MEPKTISASAIETFESCEARYKAAYIDRIPEVSGNAAALGTVCHAALERFIVDGLHLSGGTLADLHALFEEAWWDEFSSKDPDMYKAGKEMLKNWFDRNQDWSYRKVLMAEVKERFPLKLLDGSEILVTYIWDRCDQRDNGDIEVVDYKSYGSPLPVDVLKERIQPRLYALAAYIRFKDQNPSRIWVTYDLLRYDEISVAFTREECIETWNYLQRVAARILASDGTKETINSTCRWCVRKGTCETLQKHALGGGMLGVDTIEQAIEKRAVADSAAKALYGERDELDEFILRTYEEEMIDPKTPIITDNFQATLGAKRKRTFDSERIAKVIGPEVMTKYGSLTLKAIDDMLKTDDLTGDQKKEIISLIKKGIGAPYVVTKPISEFD